MRGALVVLAFVTCTAILHAEEFSAWSPAVNIGSAINGPTAEGCPPRRPSASADSDYRLDDGALVPYFQVWRLA